MPARWTYERFMYAKLGEIYHEALSYVKVIPQDISKADAAIKTLWENQGRWFNLEDARSKIKNFLCSDFLAPFFPAFSASSVFSANAEVPEIFNEKEICDSFGNLYRMDKIIVLREAVWVVDFKTGVDSKNHHEQIKKYMNVLKERHKNKNVRGFLIRVMDKNYEEII